MMLNIMCEGRLELTDYRCCFTATILMLSNTHMQVAILMLLVVMLQNRGGGGGGGGGGDMGARGILAEDGKFQAPLTNSGQYERYHLLTCIHHSNVKR